MPRKPLKPATEAFKKFRRDIVQWAGERSACYSALKRLRRVRNRAELVDFIECYKGWVYNRLNGDEIRGVPNPYGPRYRHNNLGTWVLENIELVEMPVSEFEFRVNNFCLAGTGRFIRRT